MAEEAKVQTLREAEGCQLMWSCERCAEVSTGSGTSNTKMWYYKCKHCGVEKAACSPNRLKRHLSGVADLCINRKVSGGMGGWHACKSVPPGDALKFSKPLREAEAQKQIEADAKERANKMQAQQDLQKHGDASAIANLARNFRHSQTSYHA